MSSISDSWFGLAIVVIIGVFVVGLATGMGRLIIWLFGTGNEATVHIRQGRGNGEVTTSQSLPINSYDHLTCATVMQPQEYEPGSVTRFLADDHRRLEQLLHTAVDSDHIVQKVYDDFRAGLLRHIGMEEKILLPAAQRSNGGTPLSIAATLRLDHGAIAALLIPTPTPKLIAILRSILNKHNQIEEGLDGLYATCDKLTGAEMEDLMAKLRAAPNLTVLPHSDSPAVLAAVRRAVERAGYEYPSDSMYSG